MTHYLLLKFQNRVFGGTAAALAENTLCKLPETTDWVQAVQIFLNHIDRDTNFDLLIKLELGRPEDLDRYLEHPLHLAFAKSLAPILESRATFDHL